jgi:CheY-like chemotaxis protein
MCLEAPDCRRQHGLHDAVRLRADPNLQRIVFIAATGYAQDLDRRRSAAAGFDAHVAKPIDVHELDRLIRERANSFRAAAP